MLILLCLIEIFCGDMFLHFLHVYQFPPPAPPFTTEETVDQLEYSELLVEILSFAIFWCDKILILSLDCVKFQSWFITRISISSFPFSPSKNKSKHLAWCYKELCGQYGLLRAIPFSCWGAAG